MSYNFIDLFCGAGGFSKGFELAGFTCVGAIDNVPTTVETHQLNHPESVSICDDIRNISPEEFHKRIGFKKVDVIIGGPPCPTFSTIGHAKIQSINKERNSDITEDPRNTLFLEYLKYVDYFRPEIFIIENVPNFMTKYKGRVFNTALEIIDTIGDGIYEVHKPVQVLNSVYYGVPQTRKRMFLVAHKKERNYQYPEPTHFYDQPNGERDGLKKFVDIHSAISDLPKITDNWRISEVEYSRSDNLTEFQQIMRENHPKDTVSNNICRMTNDRAKQVFSHMKQGQKYMDLPPEVRRILPFREDIFHDRLKRLILDQPSWTVIAHIGMDGYMYIHPTELRTLSVREAARIQSFPDDFVFIGNQQQTYVQVGNAVPPLLGRALAESVRHSLEDEIINKSHSNMGQIDHNYFNQLELDLKL
jgi:DNA (cytosine-5)-methyltransferase 1